MDILHSVSIHTVIAYAALQDSLKGAAAMSVNIYDVARCARVSSATVSRVLNGSPHVSEATRKRVVRTIAELDYTPNALARKLSTGNTGNIGFLIPDIENPFFAQLLRGITNAADESGYNIFLYGTDDSVEKEHRFFEYVKTERLSGILVIPVDAENEETCSRLLAFEEAGVPVVLIDRSLKHGRFDGVFSEDFRGSMDAVECLLHEGHRRIATIRGPENSRPGNERWLGYLAAFSKWNLQPDPRYAAQGDFHQERAYAAMHEIMEQDEPPTAVFAANNMTALGCLRYFREHGLRLGEDVSMIGFDEIEMLYYGGICLSVVDRDVYRMGRDAIHLLTRRIEAAEGKAAAELGRHEIFLPTRLILRGSEKWRGES